MSTIVDDTIIQARLIEEKPAIDPADLTPRKPKRGHLEAQKQVEGADGSKFRLILRQNRLDVQDFSVILGWEMPSLMRLFKLRRCNGRSHEHRNPLEQEEVFFDFHVHTATERYQIHGYSEEHYAEPTNAYTDLHGAIRHLLETCSFQPPAQETLL
jgi:hypothetical protein